ncbi:MAG: DegV family protein [Clostridia bacterium]
MSIQLFTDSSANLQKNVLKQLDIRVVSLTMSINGVEMICFDADADFDGDAFYKRMREEQPFTVKTSMINTASFIAAFEPCLQAGQDVLYVAMSSGISGTYASGSAAVEELAKKYPERAIAAVDTKAASLGEGLMVCHAAKMRDDGKSVLEIAEYILENRVYMRQEFMVDDLMFLKRGGRISGGAALLGTIINMKPIMKADEMGRIILDRKILGRKKSIRTLAEMFEAYAVDPAEQTVGIAHGGCEEDAVTLSEMIREKCGTKEFMIVCYEPGTGCHVGPGTVALFFHGEEKQSGKEPLLSNITTKIVSEADNLLSSIENKMKKKE